MMKENLKNALKRALALVLSAAVLLLTVACVAEEDVTPQSGVSIDTEASPETTEKPMEETTGVTAGAAPLYDGVLQTLANGDSFFTPGVDHMVTDTERAVLYYNDLLLVFTNDDLPAAEREALAERVGGAAVGAVSGGIHAFQIRVPEATLGQLEALADRLMEDAQVLYACGEYPVQIMGTAEDDNPWEMEGTEAFRGDEANPGGLDWWAEAIGAYTAWEYTPLCQEIRVGIVDDGFWAEHEDLKGQITFVTNNENNTAAEHGTHVAGIIGARNNDVGIRGIADTAELYCADLWPTDSPDAYHTMAEYLAVINYMAQSGVRVVNNSWACLYPSEETWLETWGGSCGEYDQWLEQRLNRDLIPTAEYCIVMISQLIASGYADMILVQGAGNDSVDARYGGFFNRVTEEVYNDLDASVLVKLAAAGITYAAIDERILVVGAVSNQRDADGNYALSWFSNYGETVDLCAPGDVVFSTVPSKYDICYAAFSGTSMAAPMVTGSVAFLWSLDPALTAAELRQLLLDSAQVQAVGIGSSEGWSCPMVNVGAAARIIAAGLEQE